MAQCEKLQNLPDLGAITILPLDTNGGLTAVGYWNLGGGDGDRTVLRFFDQNDQLLESVVALPGTSFAGIVSSAAAARWVRAAEHVNGF